MGYGDSGADSVFISKVCLLAGVHLCKDVIRAPGHLVRGYHFSRSLTEFHVQFAFSLYENGLNFPVKFVPVCLRGFFPDEFLRRFEVSRTGCPGKPVAARGLVNGRGPRRQAWGGWSEAEGLRGTLQANDN